jgi:hypothetical protein
MNFDSRNQNREALNGITEAICAASGIDPGLAKELRIDGIKHMDTSQDEQILVRIRNAPYVVCDTSGNRPNVYFELGYAFAHKKTIFLVHRKDTDMPHFNIRNKPFIFYPNGFSLRDDLAAAIKQHLKRAVTENEMASKDFFQRCNIPIVSLEGDGKYPYVKPHQGESPIRIVPMKTTEFRPPKKWADKFKKVLEKQKADAIENGRAFFKGELLRVMNVKPERDETNQTRSMQLHVQPTDYFTFASTNHSWGALDPQDRDKLREEENSHIQDLKRSALANALSVNIFVVRVIDDKEYIYFQQRNITKVAHAKHMFACTAGGMVSPIRDSRAYETNLFATAKNEIREELGLEVEENDIIFRALVRDTVNFEVSMLGEIYLEDESTQLLNPRADGFEHTGLVGCELSPGAVYSFIKANGGFGNFTPMCLGTLAFVLLGRFSPEAIESEIRR